MLCEYQFFDLRAREKMFTAPALVRCYGPALRKNSPRLAPNVVTVLRAASSSGNQKLSDERPTSVFFEETSAASLVAQGMGSALKPRDVVDQLDRHIVGQEDAKRAVAIAMRNRWRRKQLPDELKAEIIPKNILMIGPTGCGKTEIARRIAKLSQAPFIKVEATKFTEVGFHGRDVDHIIRDLVEVSINMTKKLKMDQLREECREAVEQRIIDALLNGKSGDGSGKTTASSAAANARASSAERAKPWREMLRAGELNDMKIDIEMPPSSERGGNASNVFQIDTQFLTDFVRNVQRPRGGRGGKEKRSMTIGEAYSQLEEQELEKIINMADVEREAIQAVEESGIVFIDEIDKICNASEYRGADASSEGVQRDLLPLIEGCTINTKHGNINTDYILFIGSGAFQQCKPSDLLAELQGRLPIRVELRGLDEETLYRILTEPEASVIQQQKELLATEQVDLVFTDGAIREIARVAAMLNETVENIGARRLHTVLERIVEEISFDAPDMPSEQIVINRAFVRRRVDDMLVKSDMSKYIL